MVGLLSDVYDVVHQGLNLRRFRKTHQPHVPSVCNLIDVLVGHSVLTVARIPESRPATLAHPLMITTTSSN